MKLEHSRRATLLLMAMALSGEAISSSFQILEQSPAHLGRAFAGTASNPTDASTVFFNPAAMTQLDRSVVSVGANALLVQSEFSDQASNTGGTAGETDELGLVPNAYLVRPLGPNWAFGFGVNAPFGLASSYDDDWAGRYLATESELQVANVNATVAYQINEMLSVAAGISYQEADVVLESQVDSTLGLRPDPATDSSASIRGDDSDFAFDLSAFVTPMEGTRMGLVWRQGGTFSLSGDATFARSDACQAGAGLPTGVPPAPTTGTLCAQALSGIAGPARADVELPDTLTLSASQSLTDDWSVHADVARTDWSTIETIEIVNTDNGATIDELDLQYSDTMRYALGTSFSPSGPWTWRAGIAFDEAPQTDPTYVSPRIPDQDRTWLSVGFNYELSDVASFDVGYAHLLVDDTQISSMDAQTGHRVEGEFDASVNILAVQGNWWW